MKVVRVEKLERVKSLWKMGVSRAKINLSGLESRIKWLVNSFKLLWSLVIVIDWLK